MARLLAHCPVCNKPAIEKKSVIMDFVKLRVIELMCGHSYTEKIEAQKEWETVQTDDRFGPVYKLFPYQGEGYEFARKANFRVLIGDEPGLGKTAQANTCLKLHPEELLPALLICKSALKLQHMKALMKWNGPDYMPQIIANGKDRPSAAFQVHIATYDILWRITKGLNKVREEKEKEFRAELNLSEWDILPEEYQNQLPEAKNPFAEYGYKCVILDECQQIKNQDSRRAQEVRDICRNVPHVIATSGSPIENNAAEYFTILNILRPERFPSFRSYVINYCDYYDGAYGPKVGGIRDLEWFKEQTQDFIIRRKMKDVQKDIPDLFRMFVSCEFENEKVMRAYKELQDEFEEYYYENQGDDDFTQNLLARMAKMRHLAGLNKVPFTSEYVINFLNDTNKKIVIFTHHLDVMSILNARLCKEFDEMRKTGSEILNPILYTADMNSQQREVAKFKFMEDPNARVFLASTLAAGEGLDGLQTVSEDCIILERQWNPKKEEQAERRVQRIGSLGTGGDGKIRAHYILSDGTIDEYFTELVEQKRAAVDQAMDGKEYNWSEASLVKELADILAMKGGKKWKLRK